ncbi:MAG: peptide-methionine (R)-S-oxide reductase MsrB [Vannielia sp.]|uniref:peptide-methionine (R)-S-oxide reductase MsrB n=1 Tax=Rhodobacterales TaxID=204455 RepID=UPI00209604F8|nr:peptide-methionine (R)-S-oxide reductase MsrB [Oceanicola sp. 502str15]MCO6381196.1 peptide-methionine (R)-S-oxide reductase MsrB [Oceanicola sp. 502str15]
MNRRNFLSACAATLPVALVLSPRLLEAAEGNFEITRSKAEWKAMLTDTEYAVMREEETERAGTSPLNDEKRAGTFACKGCDLPLYSSEAKYDSGTGWPSFWQSLPDAIGTKEDRKLFSVRTECHCRRCGSHLGHIFDDGPAPTGKRHCLNGVSLKFFAA